MENFWLACLHVNKAYVSFCIVVLQNKRAVQFSLAGANTTAVCWGPTLGAKVVKYRTAAVLGILCQTVGVLAFGPRQHPVFGGFLHGITDINAHPNLTLYALMWAVLTPPIWTLLAIRYRIPVPAYLGTGRHLPFHLHCCASTAVPACHQSRCVLWFYVSKQTTVHAETPFCDMPACFVVHDL